MKRTTGNVLAVFLAVMSVMLLAVNSYAKEPYKIGALFSVTGPASFLGEPEKNTAVMLQEQITKRVEETDIPSRSSLRTPRVTKHRLSALQKTS